MTNSDFDGSVRATLADVALQTPVPDGLTDRLIANAEAGRTVVTPLHQTRRRAGWTLPLLAAAAVIVVAGGAVTVSQLAKSDDRPKPPATHAPTEPPRPVEPVPDFHAATVSFRDPQHGVALGVGNCASITSTSCKVTLIATDDSGASWHVVGVPSGLHSMLSPNDPSCATNGGTLGPCVDRVLFADDSDGYLYGLHEFYWTTDGGQVWHHAPPPPADKSGVPTNNNVPTLVVADGYAYRMFATHIGSAGGSGRLQRAPVGTNNWTDIAPTDAGIYNSRIAATANAMYFLAGSYAGHESTQLYRSTDHGDHWAPVGPANASPYYLAVAANGTVALSTTDCKAYVASDGVSFTEHDLPSRCNSADTYVAGVSSGADLIVVADPVSDSGPQHVQVYRSSDGGASFHPVTSVATAAGHRTSAGMDGDFGYLSVTGDRVYLTFDGGQTWQSRSF